MSQQGRVAHATRTSKAAQRQFGHTKPTLKPLGSDTDWLAEFIASAEGLTEPFNVNSLIALQLGGTEAEREVKLRKASSMGLLRMSAYREAGVFVEYRWALVPRR